MKVKNIAFSGFAAAILATGAANAAEIASKAYVDRVDSKVIDLGTTVENLGTTVQTLNTNLTENYTTTENLGDVITTNITTALTAEDGAISKALAGKIGVDEKTSTFTDADENKIPTVGAVTAYAQQEISKVIGEDGIGTNQIGQGAVESGNLADNAVTTPKIADKNVTADKLSDELNEKIDAAQSADDVAAAIAKAVSDDEGEIKKALADKVDAEQVDAAIKGYTIPVPQANCKAESGRCVLSVDTAGELTWVDVTKPADEMEY